MIQYLVGAAIIYFIIGVALTAFCVHMSYHEAAIGFGDSDDFKVQKVLESKMGLPGYLFLFTCWPLAILIAFIGKRRQGCTENVQPNPSSVPDSGEPMRQS